MGRAYRLSPERLPCNPGTSHAACFIVCRVLWSLSGSQTGKRASGRFLILLCAATRELNSLISPESPVWVKFERGARGDAKPLFSSRRSSSVCLRDGGSRCALPLWGRMLGTGAGLQYGVLGTHQRVGVPWFCSSPSPDKCS